MPDGHTYQLVAWFQVAFTIYSVFYDQTTQHYLWYVSVNYTIYDLPFIQSARYETYDAVLRAVADQGIWK